MGQEFGGSSALWLRSEDAHEAAVKGAARAASSEGLTGDGGSASQMMRSHGWRADAGCWQEAKNHWSHLVSRLLRLSSDVLFYLKILLL